MRQALTLIVWLLLAGGLGPAAAEERLVPSWMTIDAGAKAVAMDVIAGFNRKIVAKPFQLFLRKVWQ